MYEVRQIFSGKNRLGEGPMWSVPKQTLYWFDIPAYQLFSFVPATGDLKTFTLDYQPGCLALLDDGTVLIPMTAGFAHYDFEKLTLPTGPDAFVPPYRFNDGKVDRQGRFWVGTAPVEPPVGHLYRLDTDGSVAVMENDISISNGIGWSPDNTVMYYSDSGSDGVVYAYDFDAKTGNTSNKRVFLPPTGTGAVADGLTVDSEGCIWSAFWDGWRVSRYAPDGQLLLTIDMPVQRPTSCVFGGPDLTQLYITSAGEELDLNEQPMAGDVFCIDTGIRGLPEPTFKMSPAFYQKYLR